MNQRWPMDKQIPSMKTWEVDKEKNKQTKCQPINKWTTATTIYLI